MKKIILLVENNKVADVLNVVAEHCHDFEVLSLSTKETPREVRAMEQETPTLTTVARQHTSPKGLSSKEVILSVMKPDHMPTEMTEIRHAVEVAGFASTTAYNAIKQLVKEKRVVPLNGCRYRLPIDDEAKLAPVLN